MFLVVVALALFLAVEDAVCESENALLYIE